MIVDHIDNKHETHYDNRIENLQLLTPAQNLAKERPVYMNIMTCDMKKPIEYYIDKAKKQMDETWFKAAVAGIVILLICFIVTRTIENSKRRKKASKEKRRFESHAKRR